MADRGSIPHISGNTFNEDAIAHATSVSIIYEDGDTASQTLAGITRNYRYIFAQTTWIPTYMQDVPSYTPTDLKVGKASDFRNTLNGNFGKINNQADTVANNLKGLYNSLSGVAFSSLAEDVTEDSTHRFVTDAQKQEWGSRLLVDNNVIYQRTWNGTEFVNTNVTQNFKDIVDPPGQESRIPTSTSQLTNDSDFITGSGYTSPTISVISNEMVIATFAPELNPPTPELTKKGTILIPGCTSDMSAEVVFSQSDCDTGNFSQICETFNGGVYFWCKETVTEATIKMVVLTTPSTVIPVS